MTRDQWDEKEDLKNGSKKIYRSVITCDCVAGAPGTRIVTKKIHTDGGGALLAAGAEALLMNQVAHPNVVRLLGVCPAEEAGQDAWIVMEAATCDASDAVRDASGEHSTAAEVLSMLLDASKAFVHLHTRMRCAHMDLKPENILLFGERTQRVAKIADFGVSLSLRANDALNVAGYTRQYAPPEQIAGVLRWRTQGFACDVYALGGVLFEALTGRTMQNITGGERLDDTEIRSSQVTSRWRGLNDTACEQLLALCAQCLAVDAAERPSVQTVAGALHEVRQLRYPSASDALPVPALLGLRDGTVTRDSYLSHIRASLAAHPITVLHGPPGMGKSMLAREYAEKALCDYVCVLEAWGESAAAVVEDLYDAVNIDLLPILQPHGVPALDYVAVSADLQAAAIAVAVFLHRARTLLRDPRPFLVILDGVDDTAGLDPVLRVLRETLPLPHQGACGVHWDVHLTPPPLAVLVTTIGSPPPVAAPLMNWIRVDAFTDADVLSLLKQRLGMGDAHAHAAVTPVRNATAMRPWAVSRLVSIAAYTGRQMAAEAESLLEGGGVTIAAEIDAGIRRRCQDAIRAQLVDRRDAVRLYDDATSFCSHSATLNLSITLLVAVRLGYASTLPKTDSPEEGRANRAAIRIFDDAVTVSTVINRMTNGTLHRLDLDPVEEWPSVYTLRPMFATLVPWMQLTKSHRPAAPALVTLTSLWRQSDGELCSNPHESRRRDEAPPPWDGMAVLSLLKDAATILSRCDDLGASSAPACVTLAGFALRLVEIVTYARCGRNREGFRCRRGDEWAPTLERRG